MASTGAGCPSRARSSPLLARRAPRARRGRAPPAAAAASAVAVRGYGRSISVCPGPQLEQHLAADRRRVDHEIGVARPQAATRRAARTRARRAAPDETRQPRRRLPRSPACHSLLLARGSRRPSRSRAPARSCSPTAARCRGSAPRRACTARSRSRTRPRRPRLRAPPAGRRAGRTPSRAPPPGRLRSASEATASAPPDGRGARRAADQP